jgi:hypothetical protein
VPLVVIELTGLGTLRPTCLDQLDVSTPRIRSLTPCAPSLWAEQLKGLHVERRRRRIAHHLIDAITVSYFLLPFLSALGIRFRPSRST